MYLYKATIGSQDFFLRSARDIKWAKARTVKLVRRGGGLLLLHTSGGRKVEVLITPTTRAQFEVLELPDGELDLVDLESVAAHMDLF